MLYVRGEKEKPKNFKGKWKTMSGPYPYVYGIKQITFDVENFLEADEYHSLVEWCLKSENQYSMMPSYQILHSFDSKNYKEYWSLQFLFAGSSMRLEICNKNFKTLITEIKKFISIL
jgi:hypothetical protein